jgi:hypothetical protein
MNSRRLIRSPRRGPQVIIDARRYRLLPALPIKKDGTPGTFAAQRNFDPTCDRYGSKQTSGNVAVSPLYPHKRTPTDAASISA